jgi:hypothetical protein
MAPLEKRQTREEDRYIWEKTSHTDVTRDRIEAGDE